MKVPVVTYCGIVKLAEECAELGVEIAKLQAFPEGPHPDGRGVCVDRVRDEMADVIAAIQWFGERNGVKVEWARVEAKIARFSEWDAEGKLAGVVVMRDSERARSSEIWPRPPRGPLTIAERKLVIDTLSFRAPEGLSAPERLILERLEWEHDTGWRA